MSAPTLPAAPATPVDSTDLPPARRRRHRGALALLLGALALSAGGATVWLARPHAARAEPVTQTVQYGKLSMPIVLRGDVEPTQTSDIFCRVRAAPGSQFATTIRWVIDNGVQVRRGQLLVEFDDSGLREDLRTRAVPLEQARSDWLQAEENCKLVVAQNQGDIQAAAVAVELAELDLRKFLQGDAEQTRMDLEGRLGLAEADVQAWRERVAYSARLARKGFLSSNQLRGEEARLQGAQVACDKAREEYRVFKELGRKQTVAGLRAKLDDARHALARLHQQSKALELQAQGDRLAKLCIYQRRLTRYREIEAEVAKCKVYAPQDGLVIYHASDQARKGAGQQFLVAQGELVREGQLLLHVSDLGRMEVRVRLPEPLVAHVHGEDALADELLGPGAPPGLLDPSPGQKLCRAAPNQPALLRFTAWPDRLLHGHVKKVTPLATQASWYTDARSFPTVVSIDDPVPGLRPDMTAEVTLVADDSPGHVLTVPLSAILAGQGPHRKCLVLTDEGPAEREVMVGRHNDALAEIEDGLAEGDEVVVNPEDVLRQQ